ncbi:MAG: tRNA (adenosine(37)-N6)-threonylcarbamoyltransferase complex ATPase subunit type 1 TsaE [Chloroflexi bacterium]|nr:tRNA (adenosine(37)-N6)-threonylcarbamoyltransferase complex ATPase subunit type 1 TsaE [Chloroflexota bacterium]
MSSSPRSDKIVGMQWTLPSDSPESTRRWAQALAQQVQPPLVIALMGDLGVGKTLFTQAFASALGVTVPVTSPTFTLINEYPLPEGGILYHVDCYRLVDPVREAQALGLEELFDLGFVLIEWADRIESLLPPDHVEILIEDAGPQHRILHIRDPRPDRSYDFKVPSQEAGS